MTTVLRADDAYAADAPGVWHHASGSGKPLVSQISRFRSSQGHDYSDSCESCRSMKHYL